MKYNKVFIILLFILGQSDVYGSNPYEECLIDSLSKATSDVTVSDLKKGCKDGGVKSIPTETVTIEVPTLDSSPLERKGVVESIAEELPNILVSNKSNYLLPLTYNPSPNEGPFKDDNLELDRAEVKFQFSVKSRVAKSLLFGDGDLWIGYTNLSFWQAYNTSNSSPFRETNHEPELFVDFHPGLNIGEWKTNLFRIGASHQSNGRSGTDSRSWNRIYAMAVVEQDKWAFSLKPWYRIPESQKTSPNDLNGDDNPDIYQFVGYGDLSAFYHGDTHTFGATFRNNLRENNRFGLQLDWTFPLKDKVRGYMQFYSGYGESLIDYNATVNRVGIGVMFSDIL